MNGWDWSLVIYAGIFGALDLLAWWVGRDGVHVVDGSRIRQLQHKSGELFLAMPDEVLLLD